MTYLFIGIVLAVALRSLYSMWKHKELSADTLAVGAFVLAVGAIILGVVFSLISFGIAYATAPVQVRYTNIYSMGDGMGVEGRGGFFGSFGSIDNQPVFMYYTKDDRGYFQLRHMNADRVKIVETDEGQPRFERECKMLNEIPSWADFFGMASYNGIDCGTTNEVLFFVPKGSVKNQYNLDAQ